MSTVARRARRRGPSLVAPALPEAPHGSLAALAALAREVAAARDVDAVCRALFSFAQSVGPTYGIVVSLYDPQRRLRTCVYSAQPGLEHDVSALPPMAMNASPQSVAIDTVSPVLTGDYRTAIANIPGVDLGMEADPRQPASSLALPMVVLGRTIGAFEVQSLGVAAYTADDLPGMSMAANIAALALDRLQSSEPKGRALSSLRRAIARVIDERSFSTVFQPVVELRSGAVVGYEALTRFADGKAPDIRFAEASSVGLGLELEAVTLEAAFVAAQPLPANVWLNLNVSPELVLAREPLRSLLRRWGWQTVLELTEHVAVEDYHALRRAIADLGHAVHLAIDDAGAGFSSFRHILELAPHFVKLDRALVAGIDTDPARQAFVVGMHHFSLTTGCELVAEGIETAAELDVLRALDVGLGQGYHLGRPAPIH